MDDEFKKLGDVLKLKREELSLSLKDVENSTSIRVNYLAAIEKGKIFSFLSSVYTLGFIRQYADFLKLDVKKLMQENPKIFKQYDEKHNFAYGIGTLEVRGNTTGGVKWFPNILWVGLGAFIILTAWYLVKRLGLL